MSKSAFIGALVLIMAVRASTQKTSLAQGPSAGQIRQVRVLFLVGGIVHDFDQEPKTIAGNLRKKLEREVALDFVISKDLDMLTPENIRGFGLLMLNICQQTEPSAIQKRGLLEAVRNGLPVVALHCAFWSFESWREFHQLLGAYVPGHARLGELCLDVTRPDSPITVGIPARFHLYDEPYLVDDRDPSMQSFVRTCKTYKVGQPITFRWEDGKEYKASVSGDSGEERNGPEPEVWTKMFGKGRVFAMTFGHDLRAQEDPNFLHLLQNGTLWALGPSAQGKY
jgi:type 1 glutamine amidotransferase